MSIPADCTEIVWALLENGEILRMFKSSREATDAMIAKLRASGRATSGDDVPSLVEGCCGFGRDEFDVKRFFMKPDDAKAMFAGIGGAGAQV